MSLSVTVSLSDSQYVSVTDNSVKSEVSTVTVLSVFTVTHSLSLTESLTGSQSQTQPSKSPSIAVLLILQIKTLVILPNTM